MRAVARCAGPIERAGIRRAAGVRKDADLAARNGHDGDIGRSAGPTAPDFTGIDQWLNSPPLTIPQLRGNVVLVDFWTYMCGNCLNTLPYVKQWHERYAADGLIVVGVHTPELPAERDPKNVEKAVARYGIAYPVALDPEYATWRAYKNRYWPALYLIDRQGHVVYRHIGEGDYAETEARIRALLADAAPNSQPRIDLQSKVDPPTVVGHRRLRFATSCRHATIRPNLPLLKSSTACRISACVFITNGP